MVVFYNILDVSAYNAFVLWTQHPPQPALPQHQPEQPQPQPHPGHLILKERGVRSAKAVRTERQTYCAPTARNISAKNTLKVLLFATHASKHTHIHMHVLAHRYFTLILFFIRFGTSN